MCQGIHPPSLLHQQLGLLLSSLHRPPKPHTPSRAFALAMDQQAGRCRRTDGKRWRCSKPVLPNQKYCDKHIHRGCSRSAKPVESSITPNPLNPSKVAWNATKCSTANDQSSGFAAKALKIEESEDPRDNHRMTITKTTYKPEERRNKTSNSVKFEEERLKRDPKQVPAEGRVSTHSAAADELRRRCRRTDGKRWRCTKEVVSEDHKYCAKHMHRGSKKRLVMAPQQGECSSFALVKRANKLVVGFD